MKVILKTADNVTDDDVDYTALRMIDTAEPTTDLQALTIATQYRDYALGEQLPVSITYKYKGIAQSGTLQAFIKKGLAVVYTYPPVVIQFQEAAALTTVSRDVNLGLPMTLNAGQVYSLRLEIATADGKDTSETKGTAFKIFDNAVPDPGVGDYRLIKDYVYPYGENYDGPASEATVEITIPLAQLPGGDWLSQQIITKFEETVTGQGSHMLKLVVYERDDGLTSKGYKLIATATQPDEVAGQEQTAQGIVNLAYIEPQFAAMTWAIVILAVLIALGFIVSAVVPSVREVVWGEGGVIDTVTGIGDILGNLLPMMLVMIMMTLMMEQTRDLYEPAGTPPRPKPVTETAVKIGKGIFEVGKKAAPYVVEAAKTAVKAAESAVKYATKQVQEAAEGKRVAAEADKKFYEERETESKRKLEEAKRDLKARREEQSRL